ncbi:MAG: hypothetical protein IAF02_15945 [Anaerolineae bacterium]|nr:hypothetical protein [Anaerolineae bacterium]
MRYTIADSGCEIKRLSTDGLICKSNGRYPPFHRPIGYSLPRKAYDEGMKQ